MHVDRRFLGWGVFFLLLGAIPLGVRQGWLPASALEGAWDLWPLILVGIGLHLALRRTSLDALGGLVVASTLGIMAGSAIAIGVWRFGGLGGCADASNAVAFAPVEGQLGNQTSVTLDLDCGELTLTPAAGTAYHLEGQDDDGRGPDVNAEGDSLAIRSRESRSVFGGTKDTWRMTLGTDPTYQLDIGINAGSATLDLSSMRVRELSVGVNAGDMTLDLGDALQASVLTAHANAGAIRITLPIRDLRGSVSANAGSIDLCAPDGVGLRIRTEEQLTAAYDFSHGAVTEVSDGVWETAGFATAEVKIELEASANAGAITLDPEGGCRG
jgi:hypothetical protein